MPITHEKIDQSPRSLGNLRRLAYFAAVIETGSFTAAAERLGITKVVPTISAFTRRNPRCKVDATLSDQTMDMVSGGIELRFGLDG
jgi:DNA-binding transcriptional LysR family regulator